VCRVRSAEFDAALHAPGRARRWVAELLERWTLSLLADPVTLLTGELVANAVVHTMSRPTVVAAAAHGVFELGVADSEPRLPRTLREANPVTPPDGRMAESGRGLMLVDLIAEEWGATSLSEGKQVWFRLTTPDWPHRSACLCHIPHDDRAQLASGRYVRHLSGPWDSPGEPRTD
jgi:anti-sigma regulatory factor (Ser/Thr protein kinase)